MYLKVNSQETLSIFGDTCPKNGSKNDPMVPRTTLGCPHEGPRVAPPFRPATVASVPGFLGASMAVDLSQCACQGGRVLFQPHPSTSMPPQKRRDEMEVVMLGTAASIPGKHLTHLNPAP